MKKLYLIFMLSLFSLSLMFALPAFADLGGEIESKIAIENTKLQNLVPDGLENSKDEPYPGYFTYNPDNDFNEVLFIHDIVASLPPPGYGCPFISNFENL